MKIGVTGFSGRVGGSICSYLTSKGFDVVGLEMRPRGPDLGKATSSSDQVTAIRYFACEKLSSPTAGLFDDLQVIVHCAGFSGNSSWLNRTDVEYANVLLTRILCDAMLNANRPLRFLHFSSSKVYETGQSNVDESGKLVACDAKTYAGSKVWAEKLIEKKLGQSLVSYALIRLAPLDTGIGGGKLNTIRQIYSTRLPLPIVGQGCDIDLSICSVETLQKFIPLLVEQPLPNGPINMCDNDAVSLRSLMLSSSPAACARLAVPSLLMQWLKSVFGTPVTMDNRTLRRFGIDGN